MEDNFNDIKISKKIKEKLKDKKKLKKELQAGKTAQEILEYSDASMEKLYRAARHLFENRHYVDAANGFIFLVTLNPYHHDYWIGLGMSVQMYGDFEAAIDAYEMAAVCQIDNPIPYFYLAKCLFALHERKSAEEALDIAIEYASDNLDFQELKTKALAARNLLRRHH